MRNNAFTNEPICSRHIASIMRDINEIEAQMVNDGGLIDIVIAIDCTGSMGSVIANVKSNANQMMLSIRERAPLSWFGAIKFRDSEDDFVSVVAAQPSESTSAFQAAINTFQAAGGGDAPEAYIEAVLQAAQVDVGFGGVSWRAGAKRLLIVLGDAPPHDPLYETGTSSSGYTWAQAARAAKNSQLIVSMIAVGAGVGNATVSRSYSDMTRETGGIYMQSPDPDQAANALVEIFNIIAISQTPFYAYRLTSKVPLGTPDTGITVPADNALVAADADLVPNHIIDLRAAVQRIVSYGYWKNPATSQPYNWISNNANNLYRIAMGDRTAYGATGGLRYGWTRSLSQMVATPPLDIDIGEVFECVRVLKSAAGV